MKPKAFFDDSCVNIESQAFERVEHTSYTVSKAIVEVEGRAEQHSTVLYVIDKILR